MTNQEGFTLVELVISMVALSVIMTGAIVLFNGFMVNQAIQNELTHANRLASVFVADVARLSYASDTSASTRSEFTSVDDYEALEHSGCDTDQQMPCDPTGNPMPHYKGYQVDAFVEDREIGDREAKHIRFVVTTPTGGELVMESYKFRLTP